MTTIPEQDNDRIIEIPAHAAEDLADGCALVVGGDDGGRIWRALVITPVTADAGQLIWRVRTERVPVLTLDYRNVTDLLRGRPARTEKLGVRYLIRVFSVDLDDWDDEDED